MILKTGPWNLTDLESLPKHGKTVFSCFHCGGGSSMGYKLAGFDVLGGVEIDPEMMKIYRANHKPKHSYLMGVKEFQEQSFSGLPKELFELDILDGSPPCSSFSMAGSREKEWGNEKKFREGQALQVLDDLFFDFISIAKMLKPKIVIAENVKGLMIGNAKGYIKQIAEAFDKAGYDVQLFLLNAAFMGVPQRRERTFFIARRKDLKLDPIKLKFEEAPIPVRNAIKTAREQKMRPLTEETARLWKISMPGNALSKVHKRGSRFNAIKHHGGKPASTITASGEHFHFDECRRFNDDEIKLIQTFPMDYDFQDIGVQYVCGMSVPPFMMQRVAHQIYRQWLAPKTKIRAAKQESSRTING